MTPNETGGRAQKGGRLAFPNLRSLVGSRATVPLKKPWELKIMARAGMIVAEVLKLAEKMSVVGAVLCDIDAAAEDLIRSRGATPAFKHYHPAGLPYPYPYTICASVNEEVVHGFANERRLAEGDIFSVDVGAQIDGYFGDAARTFEVGSVGREARKLVRVCREALENGSARMVEGGNLSDVSRAVQEHAETNGFGVVRQFVGHGIGRKLHEEPQIPNFVSHDYVDCVLQSGMVFAIEPMINVGSWRVETLADGWTVVTSDGKLSAHFENTVAVTPRGPVVLTAMDAEAKIGSIF